MTAPPLVAAGTSKLPWKSFIAISLTETGAGAGAGSSLAQPASVAMIEARPAMRRIEAVCVMVSLSACGFFGEANTKGGTFADGRVFYK